jgi:hypothetical protein
MTAAAVRLVGAEEEEKEEEEEQIESLVGFRGEMTTGKKSASPGTEKVKNLGLR